MAKRSENIELSNLELEFINGALLGDGCLSKPRGNSSQFIYTTSKKTHAEYVYETLRRLSVNENKNGPTKTLTYDRRTTKTYTSYRFRTRCNRVFKELYCKWYPLGKKIIPADIKLTPPLILIWYVGDGGIINGNRSQYIKISTHAFDKIELEEILLPQLKCFEPHLINAGEESQYYIYIPHRRMKAFLDCIGECPVKEYEYKWDIKPYIYKNVEINGVMDYTSIYPAIIKDWNVGNLTIYGLSKKYNVPIRCIKDELTRNGVLWNPIDNKKAIEQYDLLDNYIKTWYSGQEIKRKLGFNASGISECCREIRKHYKGYIWKFAKTKTPLEPA